MNLKHIHVGSVLVLLSQVFSKTWFNVEPFQCIHKMGKCSDLKNKIPVYLCTDDLWKGVQKPNTCGGYFLGGEAGG